MIVAFCHARVRSSYSHCACSEGEVDAQASPPPTVKRVCLGWPPGTTCTALTETSRCPTHTRLKDQARGTRQARGYDNAHDRARAELIRHLPLSCAYGCGTILYTAHELVAAHRVDGHPEHGYQPSCRTCNEHAKTRHPPGG